jgi:HPt (histidine-containing phosphotransfer) domain-containing protein
MSAVADDGANNLFDKNAALKRLGGSISLLREMFQFFVEDAPALVDSLESALERNDIDEAYRAAHSLKGLASNFDAHAVTLPAKQIEEHLRKHDLASAAALTSEVRQNVAACIAEGRRVLESATA